jgi:NitT/TauT family transport system substrate-binding protein
MDLHTEIRAAGNRLATALLLITLVAACAPQEAKTTPDEVTVQLKWVHQAQFAGLYVAQEKGYYAQENLKVNFLEGGQDIDIAEPVISGQAHFGVVAPEDILVKRGQGAPITAIAAIYRRSAVVFVSMADSGILRPVDFLGKGAAVTGISGALRDFELEFYALMKKLGLDISRVKLETYDPEYTGFCKGDVDVTAAFYTGGVIRMRQKGYRLNLIWPGDYGVHFYSDTLIAAEETITRKPELVTRFLRATLKGWREAIGDPVTAVNATLKYARIPDPDFQKAMMEALLPLVHTGEDQIGWMKAEAWQEMHQIMLDQGLVPAPLELNKVYTMQFLQEVYGGKAK